MHRCFAINEYGHSIRCKLYCQDPKAIRRIVVFLHGFGGHKDNASAEKFAQRLLSKYKGTALLTFNWPAHGDDVKKKLTLADCEAYLTLVVSFLRQKYRPEVLCAYATSFGGYLLLKYLCENENPFRRIVLRSPAVNMHEALTGTILTPAELESLQRGRDISAGFDRKVTISPAFVDSLRENDIRARDFLDQAEDILILHGTADEVIPFEAVRTFADDQLMELIPIPGADHRFRDPVKTEQATKHILEFFRL